MTAIKADIVSVLIPAFNVHDTIERCLDSIEKQLYDNLQIVVVDDGSTDDTLQLLTKFAQKDKRVQIIRKENAGIAAARNTLLDAAIGDYILFVDADDWIESCMIKRMVELMHVSDDVDIVFCGHDNLQSMTSPVIYETNHEIWDTKKQIREFLFHRKMTGMLWNKMIRRSLFHNLRFNEDIGYGEDSLMLWHVIQNSRKMCVTEDILYHHVLSHDSISGTAFSHKKYTAILVWEQISNSVNAQFPELSNIGKMRVAETAIYSYYELKKSNYKNNEEKKHLREIVKSEFLSILRSKHISPKMKLYSILIILGH